MTQNWLIFRWTERTRCIKKFFSRCKVNYFLSSYAHSKCLIDTGWIFFLIDPLFTCCIKPKTSLGLYALPIKFFKFRVFIYHGRTGMDRIRMLHNHHFCNIIAIIVIYFISNIVFSILPADNFKSYTLLLLWKSSCYFHRRYILLMNLAYRYLYFLMCLQRIHLLMNYICLFSLNIKK